MGAGLLSSSSSLRTSPSSLSAGEGLKRLELRLLGELVSPPSLCVGAFEGAPWPPKAPEGAESAGVAAAGVWGRLPPAVVREAMGKVAEAGVSSSSPGALTRSGMVGTLQVVVAALRPPPTSAIFEIPAGRRGGTLVAEFANAAASAAASAQKVSA